MTGQANSIMTICLNLKDDVVNELWEGNGRFHNRKLQKLKVSKTICGLSSLQF